MYKIICNWTHNVIWSTRDKREAVAIAKKYGAAVYKRNEKILDFKQEEKYMENLFIIMIWTGGFGLLLCLGVGIQKLSSRALKWFRRLRHRQDVKKSQKKARLNFERYNIIIK